MSIQKYLNAAPHYEITRYKSENFEKHCIPFSGTPKKHPYDPEKLLLIQNPFSDHTIFFEFKLKDIEHADDLPSIVTEEGESLSMVKIWVKKGSFGLKYYPFEVGENQKISTQS